jgi:alanine racemase
VVSVRARVISVRRLRRGESVSYNASWTAARDTVIATLRCGYADGLGRAAGTDGGAHVLLRGQRCPIVGFVQMDMALVETGTLEVQVGDTATIVGADAKQRIALHEAAAWNGVIQHEFLTGLGPRLARVPM